MDHAQEVLERVAQAAHLREGAEGAAAFLRTLYRGSPLPTGELARRLGWPTPVVAAVRGELLRAGLVERAPGGTVLSTAGKSFARRFLGAAALPDPLCPTCAGRRLVVEGETWQEVLARLAEVHRHNPPVDTTLDQSHGTPETALRRALYMYREGALEGKNVLVLGDDDLVSVAIGLLSRLPMMETGAESPSFPARLVVVDVDERFLAHIAAAGREHGFAVETVAHDLRDPLPAELGRTFDTVETDPPYTLAGLRLFLSRGLEALRPGGGRDVFLSYAPRDPAGQQALLATCVELNLAPYAVVPDFNRYVGAGTLAGSGQFLHLRTTPEARPALPGRYEGAIYTMEERPRWREYRCLDCGSGYRVGPGQALPTIESLIAQGCPACGGRTFRPGRRKSR